MEREIISLEFPVPGECAGWRLDHFLKRRIGRLSRTKIQLVIREQISFADGRRARASSSVRAGEIIHLRRPAPLEPEVPRTFSLLYEDETVLAIDKPAGLPMHTTAKFWKNTLAALLRERYPDEPVHIAHRIDRETSGVLLAARTRAAASFLTLAFARRQVQKTYLALVKGAPPDVGIIDRPLALFRLGTGRLLLLGPLASRRVAGAGRSTWSAARGRPGAEATRCARRTEVSRACARRTTRTWASEAAARSRTAKAAGPRRAGARWARREAGPGRPGTAEPGRTHRTWSRGLGLRLLDDDGAPLEHAAREFLDRRLRALVRRRFDEREATRASRVAVEGHAYAAQLDPLARERLPQLLLVDVVRKIADEKSGTHYLFLMSA